jgi:hypothetical protein
MLLLFIKRVLLRKKYRITMKNSRLKILSSNQVEPSENRGKLAKTINRIETTKTSLNGKLMEFATKINFLEALSPEVKVIDPRRSNRVTPVKDAKIKIGRAHV